MWPGCPEKRALTLSIAAVPKEPDQVELHPMWNLDADGSYVGDSLEDYEDDGEARAEHWLWTAKGCGPVTEFMENPSKKLMLFEADEVYIGPRRKGWLRPRRLRCNARRAIQAGRRTA